MAEHLELRPGDIILYPVSDGSLERHDVLFQRADGWLISDRFGTAWLASQEDIDRYAKKLMLGPAREETR